MAGSNIKAWQVDRGTDVDQFVVVEDVGSGTPGLPSLDASQILNLDASQVTSGTFDDARISESSVTQHVAVLKNPEDATDSGTDAYVSQTTTTPPNDGDLIARDFQSINETVTPELDGSVCTTKDGSALWANALFGVHDLQYASSGPAWRVIDPNTGASTVPPLQHQGESLQDYLDAHSRRAVTSYLKHGTFTFSSPLLVGQNTTLLGTNGDLENQPESDASWDFSPHQVFDFSGSDINGVESDPNATYRVHHPIIRDLLIKGIGVGSSTKSGVLMSNNANADKTGFFELENVFIEEFQNGADGVGSADGARFHNCHFRNVENGIINVATEVWIRACTFWHFTIADGSAIDVDGERALISENEFEMGGGSGSVTSTNGVDINAQHARVTTNHWKTAYKYGILANSGLAIITGNTFEGDCAQDVINLTGSAGSCIVANNIFDVSSFVGTVLRVDASDCLVEGNHFEHLEVSGAADMTKDVIVVSGDRNQIVNNEVPNDSFNSAINIQAGASENIIKANLRDGLLIDNGTRTVINGRGTNDGDPNSTGDWNGFASLAYNFGIFIRDFSTDQWYAPNPGGTFTLLG